MTQYNTSVTIDVSGSSGNAMAILGAVDDALKAYGVDDATRRTIRDTALMHTSHTDFCTYLESLLKITWVPERPRD